VADHPDLPDDPSGDDGGSGLPPEIEQLIARLTGGPVDPQMAKAFKDMGIDRVDPAMVEMMAGQVQAMFSTPSEGPVNVTLATDTARKAVSQAGDAVVSESAGEYFEIAEGKERYYPYMLFVAQTRPEHRDQLGAVTHVDGSARLQTVDKEENPRFWALLKEFEELTGLPVLLNTSFNLKGQPIVKDPAVAIETFVVSNLDALVIGDYLVTQRSDDAAGGS